MRPSGTTRLLMTAVCGFFVAGLIYTIVDAMQGELEWTTMNLILVPLLGVVSLSTVVGAAAAWTNRVWVDYDRRELRQVELFRTHVRSLDPPATARLTFRAAALGSSVSPTWAVVFEEPGRPRMRVSTPWVRDIGEVLLLLQPVVAANPDLPADDYTRRSIAAPANLRLPSSDA